MKIGVLVTHNPYGTTQTFSEELIEALENAGHLCKIYRLEEESFSDTLFQLFNDDPDCTCSFSDITAGGVPISERLQKPHLTMLVDPAIYFLHQIKASKSIVSCVDLEDVNRLRERGFSNVYFLPHAISNKHFDYPFEGGERMYEAVFFGTCIDFEQVRKSWREKYPKIIALCLENASERALLSPYPSILQCLLKELDDLSLKPFTQDLALLHHEVDLFVRGKDRYELILTCSKQSKVHIWGEGIKGKGWNSLLNSPDISIYPSINFKQTLEILKKSRFLINSTARFTHSGHERILYALAYGAMPITTESPFIHQFFPSNSLITYQPSNYHNLNLKISSVALNAARNEAKYFVWPHFISLFNGFNY